MRLTKKELLRLEELEITARDNFLSKASYDPVRWLDNKKQEKEYERLIAKELK